MNHSYSKVSKEFVLETYVWNSEPVTERIQYDTESHTTLNNYFGTETALKNIFIECRKLCSLITFWKTRFDVYVLNPLLCLNI